MRNLIKRVFYLLGAFLILIIALNIWLIRSTESQVYTDISKIPTMEVGLVLGTSHRLQSGDSNMFFYQRIDQAVQLYQMGKIKHLIVSGDNGSRYYNEPQKMKNTLMDRGIPEHAISMDFAGFRTLDSIIRSKLIFGQQKMVIITQDFHSYRALFIANFHQIEAVASVGSKLPLRVRLKTELREIMARGLAIFDLYILNKQPKFLGEKEELNANAPKSN